ncbi:GNAT family N-acetyltransferase [Halalkalibacter sp. APA_J-10(15)]|uniref:GNAT family N-acetyltransferase n=1 Tax=Halalkalibacter sp. APA_J-10(15) TaxID=2933805 RepID=UPI001FF20801|nr:GNAT family N-acetyltransferase [Halalkalibacter sp. APA_J-10(15)]MCK0470420.1 GNAT family N-acetyltransferase [Halalkalibacter sp. APA_J-10(15)]
MIVEVMSFTERPIKANELMKLYRDVGWWEERKEQDIEKMLKQEVSVGAWKGDVLIGFARAVSDGNFRAYIEDVVIHKKFQKSGIGTKIVSKLVKELSHIDVISLFCEKDLIPFYEKNAFKYGKSQFVMHKK